MSTGTNSQIDNFPGRSGRIMRAISESFKPTALAIGRQQLAWVKPIDPTIDLVNLCGDAKGFLTLCMSEPIYIQEDVQQGQTQLGTRRLVQHMEITPYDVCVEVGKGLPSVSLGKRGLTEVNKISSDLAAKRDSLQKNVLSEIRMVVLKENLNEHSKTVRAVASVYTSDEMLRKLVYYIHKSGAYPDNSTPWFDDPTWFQPILTTSYGGKKLSRDFILVVMTAYFARRRIWKGYIYTISTYWSWARDNVYNEGAAFHSRCQAVVNSLIESGCTREDLFKFPDKYFNGEIQGHVSYPRRLH